MSKVFVPEGFLNNTTVDSSTSGNSQTIKSNVYVPEGFLESFETEPSTIDKFKYGVAQETMLLGDIYRLSVAGITLLVRLLLKKKEKK